MSHYYHYGWLWSGEDPDSIDPVDLALAPYCPDITYYHAASGSRREIFPLLQVRFPRGYPSSSPPPPSSSRQTAAAISAAPAASRRQQSIDPTISKRARIPASSKAILGLKEVVLLTTTTAGTTDDDDDNCAICLKPLADPADHDKEEPTAADVDNITKLRAMPCFHTFHQHCIFEWLRRSAACPLCRRQLPTTDDDDDDDDDYDDDDDNDD